MLYKDFDCDCGNEGCDEMSHEGVSLGDEQAIITMVDAETGEEYQFAIVDDFEYKEQSFCVLLTVDEEEPELVITKVVEIEDGQEGLMSLDEDEMEDVYAEYDRLCEEAEFEDEDEEE